MLITEHFVFVHVPKTGGSFVRELCRRHLRVLREYDQHLTYDRLPREYAGFPAIRFVRNPWDWYVSLYHYASMQDKPGPVGNLFGVDRDATFAEFVTAACAPPELPPKASGSGSRWLRAMNELDCDLYTALDHVMVGGRPEVEASRFEQLREGVLAFLERHEIPVDDAFKEAILTSAPIYPPLGPTGRGSYPSYYDDRLRDLVGSRSPLAATYGYTFGG